MSRDGLIEEQAPLLESEVSFLAGFYSRLVLTSEQEDQIARLWLQASRTERRLIASVYYKLFTSPAFVQRVRNIKESQLVSSANPMTASSGPSNVDLAANTAKKKKRGRGETAAGTEADVAASSTPLSSPTDAPRMTKFELKFRSSIDEVQSKVSGEGPFILEFGLMTSDAERQEVLQIYASHFKHPDPAATAKIVSLPRGLSTRTRTNISGAYTWFIRCVTTNEIACCVTAVVHKRGSKPFLEVPLFATRSGYQKNGLARLLNAALAQFCVDHMPNCSMIMVSADQQAVTFWRHLGFREISNRDKSSISYEYLHYCIKFESSCIMTLPMPQLVENRDMRLRAWAASQHHTKQPPNATTSEGGELATDHPPPYHETNTSLLESVSSSILIMDVLTKMPRFVITGTPHLGHS